MPIISFILLVLVRTLSRLLYRFEVEWVGEVSDDPWNNLRVVAILNHTSLYEPILIGVAPLRFVWQVAVHGVVPVAAKTMERPVTGRFFRLLIANAVSISRKRDDTWQAVLERVDDPRSMMVILPEGRMKRPDGLDWRGQPMTVRGGIADLLKAAESGRLLLVYSAGLHHIQQPGQRWPKLFQPVRLRLEVIEVAEYRRQARQETGIGNLRGAVIADLTRRRDLYCAATARDETASPTRPH